VVAFNDDRVVAFSNNGVVPNRLHDTSSKLRLDVHQMGMRL